MHHNRLMMDELKLDQESVRNLRLRGGYGSPAFVLLARNQARYVAA